MESQTFSRMLEEIYSAFGRERPSVNSATYRSLQRRVCQEGCVPNEAARFIAYAIAGYDSLPTNVGKAILREFQNWLSENPQRRATARGCPECSRDFPGFFWANDGGHDFLCKCACNTDPSWDRQRAWTHRQAREAGFAIGLRLTQTTGGAA